MRIVTVVGVLALAVPAFAQIPENHQPRHLIISDRAVAAALATDPPTPPPMQSRDSLKNGTIIGAVVGGLAMGAAGSWVCQMLKEPGDPPCWKSVLPVTAIFAGIGAGVGAGIDALASRPPQYSVRPPSAEVPQFLRRERN